MFGKLVKHEFRATARIIPFVYLVTIFLAVVHIITTRFNLGVVSKISLVLMVIMCVVQVAVTFILLIWRYYKNNYSSEAYLTHTLPVHPSLLLWSKYLVAFIWSLLSILVGIAVVAAIVLTDLVKTADKLGAVSQGYRTILMETGMTNHQTALWLIIIGLVVVTISLALAEMYFAITVGSLSKMHSLGIGGPILIYFAEYTALQIINIIVVLFIPLGVRISTAADGSLTGAKMVFQNMYSNLTSITQTGALAAGQGEDLIIGIGQYILLPLIAIGLLFWTARIITRRTSLK